jgi:plasmid stabilization system protein ParE
VIPVKVLPQAEHDISNAARWYEERLPERRGGFLASYRAAVERAARFPHSGSPVRDLRAPFQVRRFWLRDFPYAVIIAVLPHLLVVFALSHERQDQKHWRKRVAKVLR